MRLGSSVGGSSSCASRFCDASALEGRVRGANRFINISAARAPVRLVRATKFGGGVLPCAPLASAVPWAGALARVRLLVSVGGFVARESRLAASRGTRLALTRARKSGAGFSHVRLSPCCAAGFAYGARSGANSVGGSASCTSRLHGVSSLGGRFRGVNRFINILSAPRAKISARVRLGFRWGVPLRAPLASRRLGPGLRLGCALGFGGGFRFMRLSPHGA